MCARGGEVDELVADRLVARERTPERVALAREGGCALPGDLHRADCAERHRQALPLEVGHDQLEPLVELAEQVLLCDEHVLEADRGGIGGVPAELLELRRAHPLLTVDDQKGDAVVASLLRGFHGGHDEMGAHTVGDVGLLAVDHPPAVDARGARAQRGDVRARVRLGDRKRADPLPADGGHEVALLLILGAELPDRRRRDR